MSTPTAEIRAARNDDADAIVALLGPYVLQEIVLPRTADEIRKSIGNFLVATAGHRVVGAVAVRDFGDGLQEIRSLVVSPECTGAGLGSRLVDAAVSLAAQRDATRVFALTMRPRLFARQGFESVDMDLFPQKVWSDCVKCPKRDRCDEVAVQLQLPTSDEKPRG